MTDRHELLNALSSLEACARFLDRGEAIPDMDAFTRAILLLREHLSACLGDGAGDAFGYEAAALASEQATC